MKTINYKSPWLDFKQIFIFSYFLFSSLIVTAKNINYDNLNITLHLKDALVSEVFLEIEKLTEFKFFYKNKDIDLDRVVTIKVKEAAIDYVLTELFKESLNFKIRNNQIILYKPIKSYDIKGKVIDIKTNEPISFATIRIKSKGIGLIADENGFFRIPEKYKILNDSLQITSIGYKTKLVLLKDLDEKVLNLIKMNEAIESLSQVVIKGKRRHTRSGLSNKLSANDIIKNAIDNIPNNYPIKPYSYIGYYRDYQIKDKDYLNLNEALLELFDGGFQTNKYQNELNQSVLYDYRVNSQFKRDSTITIAYNNSRNEFNIKTGTSAFGGNEMESINLHDPIRNYQYQTFSFINVLENHFLKNHFFTYVGQINLDGIKLHHIKFVGKDAITTKSYAAEGNIYIETRNFAIHKLEYLGFKKKETRTIFDPVNLLVVKDKNPFFKINIEYARHDDKMYIY